MVDALVLIVCNSRAITTSLVSQTLVFLSPQGCLLGIADLLFMGDVLLLDNGKTPRDTAGDIVEVPGRIF